MAEPTKQAPYLARAVLHNLARIEAGLRARHLNPRWPNMTRTWREGPNGVRVTLTLGAVGEVKDGRGVAEALVGQLRYLGFYAAAVSYSPPAVVLSGYSGERF